MTTTAARSTIGTTAVRRPLGRQIVRVITSTDHKVIGNLYLVTSFAWFLIAGVMAMIMRSELAYPGNQLVNDELYNQLFTMHGTIMLLLFATPLFFGFGNAIMPLQIGSPDVAFPRLNMLSYWLFLFGGLIAASGFLTPQGAADFGWFAYTPLSDAIRSPGVGGDLWVMGLWMAGLGTILGAVNFTTTIICMRAPGMTMFRMPIFVWNTLVTSLLVLIAFPVLAGALLSLEADRLLGRPRLRHRPRRRDPVAAPVLVLRAPRGLHHRPAVLRHHHRDPAGVQPQADLRLRRPGRRHPRHRDPVGRRVGPPHVRHRGRGPAVLLRHDVPDRRSHRREVLQLDRHDVGRVDHVPHAHAVGDGLPDDLPVRRPDRHHPGQPAARLPRLRLLLRRGALPLRRLRHRGLRDVRRVLLLVAQADRPDARRAPGLPALLAALHRVPHHVPGAALAGGRGHAAPDRRLPARGRLHVAQPGLDRGRVHPGRLDAAVPLQRLDQPSRSARRDRRPVGLGPFAGVGDEQPAAAPQLRHHPADPLGVAGLRPAPPGGRRDGAGAQRGRSRGQVRRRPRDGRPRGDAQRARCHRRRRTDRDGDKA